MAPSSYRPLVHRRRRSNGRVSHACRTRRRFPRAAIPRQTAAAGTRTRRVRPSRLSVRPDRTWPARRAKCSCRQSRTSPQRRCEAQRPLRRYSDAWPTRQWQPLSRADGLNDPLRSAGGPRPGRRVAGNGGTRRRPWRALPRWVSASLIRHERSRVHEHFTSFDLGSATRKRVALRQCAAMRMPALRRPFDAPVRDHKRREPPVPQLRRRRSHADRIHALLPRATPRPRVRRAMGARRRPYRDGPGASRRSPASPRTSPAP